MLEQVIDLIVHEPILTILLALTIMYTFELIEVYVLREFLGIPIFNVMDYIYRLVIGDSTTMLFWYVVSKNTFKKTIREMMFSTSRVDMVRLAIHTTVIPGFIEEMFYRFMPAILSLMFNTPMFLVISNLVWIIAHYGTNTLSIEMDTSTYNLMFLVTTLLVYFPASIIYSLMTIAYLTYGNVVLAYLIPAITHTIHNLLAILTTYVRTGRLSSFEYEDRFWILRE